MYLHERGRKIDSWVNYNDLPSGEMLRDVEEWKALGATHLSINTMNCAMKFPDEHIRAIATFKDGISAWTGGIHPEINKEKLPSIFMANTI